MDTSQKRKRKLRLFTGAALAAALLFGQMSLNGEAKEMKSTDTGLQIQGPEYYRLDKDGKVTTDYDISKYGSLIRCEKPLRSLRAGKIRTVAQVHNSSGKDRPVKLITVLEDKDNKREDVLEVSKVSTVKANSDAALQVDATIPSDGNYEFKTYLWDSVQGMKPLKNTTVLTDGPSGLDFAYTKPYSKENPSIELNWTGAAGVTEYDVYVEGEKVLTTDDTSCRLNLKPYTPYKIYVQGVKSDGKYTSASNSVCFMTEDTQASQDARMEEWNDDRFGLFVTWGGHAVFGGVYKGPNANGENIDYDSEGGGNGAYSEWIKFGAGIPDDIYKKRVEQGFTAEKYDSAEWVQIAKNAGMKYIVLTTKHHEGFTLFNTAAKNGWSVQDTVAKARVNAMQEKDFLRQLILEGAKEGIKVGAYYSQTLDWAQPGSIGWTPQRAAGWTDAEVQALKQEIIASGVSEDVVNQKIYDILGGAQYQDMVKMNREVIIPQVEELMNMKVTYNGKQYGIDTLWWDMGQKDYPEINYEIMKKVVSIDKDKKIKMNNRILHEEKYSTMPFDYVTPEQSIPSAPESKYWETCMTMNRNWGYAKNDHAWKQSPELVEKLTRIASLGGNFLLNVGPKPDGSFPDEAVKLLGQVGDYMDINGEAIYGTEKSPFLNDLPWGYATQKGNKIYLSVFRQEYLDNMVIPGLKTKPEKAEVITGSKTYSAPLGIHENTEYKGYTLSGDALKEKRKIASVVVLTFDSENIEFEECNKKFPVIQDAKTGHITLKAADSEVTTSDPDGGLIVEGGGNFGRWNHTEDYASWTLQASVPGKYTVDVDYATPLKGSLEVLVKKEDGTLISRAKSQFGPSADKDGWVVYANRLLGTAELPEAGTYLVEIHRDNSGPDDVAVDNGPVNITQVHLKPIAEYELNTITRKEDTKEYNFPSAQGLRSAASGMPHSEVSYDMKTPGNIIWKFKAKEAAEQKIQVRGSTGRSNVKLRLVLKDKNMQPLTSGGKELSVEQIVKSADWSMDNMKLNDTLELNNITEDCYLELQVMEGIINVQSVTFTDISVQGGDEEELEQVKTADTDPEEKYVSLYMENSPALLEQNIMEQLKASGAGIYQYSFTYRSAKALTLAVDVNGVWKTYQFPQAADWKKGTVSFEVTDSNITEAILKPIDNFSSMSRADEINIGTISLKKKDSGQEVIKNGSLLNSLADWNHSNVISKEQERDDLHLRAYDAVLDNQVNEKDDRDVIIEARSDSDKDTDGQFGNWWDPMDGAHWNIKIYTEGYYRVQGNFGRLWQDGTLKVKIKDKENNTIGNGSAVILDDGVKSRDMGLFWLKAGEYRVEISRSDTPNPITFYSLDLLLADEEQLPAITQTGEKLEARAQNAVTSGDEVRISGEDITFWKNKNDSIFWKLKFDSVKNFSIALQYASDAPGKVKMNLYNSKGELNLTKEFGVTEYKGWGETDYHTVGNWDLSTLETGEYYLEMICLEGNGLNLRSVIFE